MHLSTKRRNESQSPAALRSALRVELIHISVKVSLGFTLARSLELWIIPHLRTDQPRDSDVEPGLETPKSIAAMTGYCGDCAGLGAGVFGSVLHGGRQTAIGLPTEGDAQTSTLTKLPPRQRISRR